MERIVRSAVSINKPKPTEINVTKPTPNLVTEAIVIEKPRHIEVTVSKGSVGINGRNGINGINGKDGRDGTNGLDGEDGGVFVPRVVNGILSWDYQEDATEYPSSTNILANIESIPNSDIFNVVNGD